MDECAAHYSPVIDDPKVLPAKGLLKIDCGAQVDGFIADAAVSVNLDKEDELNNTLITAAEDGLYQAIKNFKAGVNVKENWANNSTRKSKNMKSNRFQIWVVIN